MLEILNILSTRPGLGPPVSADALHLIAEAQKLAWADRGAYVADPDFPRCRRAADLEQAYAAPRAR